MPRKKTEETAAETTTEATAETAPTSEETSTETQSADSATAAGGNDTADSSSIVGSIIDTVSSAVETVAGTVASTVGSVATTITDAVGITGGADEAKTAESHRAQRIGVVTSDKMTKTVVVRVDRLIKHPKYRRYVRRKKQFMAHDELGATTGDKVRIVETRPLSARKRWRVVEIVQKAAK
jgi:small subunit ribosomal protein S17